MMKTVGVILAGGNSTRFGEDKALYELQGTPMYEHIADAMKISGVTDEIIVSTNQRLAGAFNYETVTDVPGFLDKGPLGGIYAAAKHRPGCRLMVVSCDTPYVPAEWLLKLHRAAQAYEEKLILTEEGGQLHPLIGIYQGTDLAGALKAQLETDRLSMRAFSENRETAALDAAAYGVHGDALVNINRRMDIL
ncbi:MAG TPA: molybdenum cofactor guanylyltransferase [Candidatus Salinicoccus stercoripullorum]|uniref:Molybdenum cofactor guanylyltransferase n=1 Tax=Candidatus Salinicoccus stercoripullorum TaxID=2838756 RepID=A0A9D1QGC6_9STAP|nr:molybdenum cofactor guanylyltransferase [Candidatus Salinicoccus stercoripullorum]